MIAAFFIGGTVRDQLRIGLAYNQKPESDEIANDPVRTQRFDRFLEWDDQATIDAVAHALGAMGKIIRLEASPSFPLELSQANVDIVFNLAEGLEGPNREAHVPAICEFLGIPYTGSDPLTLCLSLHKARSKEVFAARHIPSPAYHVVEQIADLDACNSPFPLFAKPVMEGSSKGISVRSLCHTREDLTLRVAELLEAYQQPVLVEAFLSGDEYTVAILGTGAEARALPLVRLRFEVLPEDAVPVYGYEAKWVWDTPERPLDLFECPARVDQQTAQAVTDVALQAYRALGCRDWGRVDVRCDAEGTAHVIEVNPLPGVLPNPDDNSCFPKAAREAGMSYDELIQHVVGMAWQRSTGGPIPSRGREVA